MEQSFSYWKNKHDSGNLEVFNSDTKGQLWLKTKSIIRTEFVLEFATCNGIALKSRTLNKQFEELYNILQTNVEESHLKLDSYIRGKNKELLNKLDKDRLVSELFKLKTFEWGGDYNNSLDKYLVSHYVKAISSYDELISKFEKEINKAVQGYVLNSWYNHWSSILIEHVFKQHPKVLPTVGQIKNVDFFINNVPYDLKVTYFPLEYLKAKRKEKGYPVELTFLKTKAKELEIHFDKNASTSDIYYEITEKLKNRNDEKANNVLEQVKNENTEIIKETQKNPKLLAKWLYENQGEMRFGSENRLFLVLIDPDNFSNSWKLKRNLDLLTPTINSFLDGFISKNIPDLTIEFSYPGKTQIFRALADVIFIIK